MANFLNRFSKSIKGLNVGGLKDYISVISPSGEFSEIRDIDVILNSWTNILMTPKNSYLDDPDYGSELYKYIFAPADQRTIDRIEYEINYVIQKFDNRANIDNVDIKFTSDKKGFIVDVNVSYKGNKERLKLYMTEDLYFNIFKN